MAIQSTTPRAYSSTAAEGRSAPDGDVHIACHLYDEALRPVRSSLHAVTAGGSGLARARVVSSDGQPVGKLIDVYVNNESGEPEVVLLVASGFLHNPLHLAPAEGHAVRRRGGDARVTKDAVGDAPHIAADGDLSPDEELRLRALTTLARTPRTPRACSSCGDGCPSTAAPQSFYDLAKRIGSKVNGKWRIHVDDLDAEIRLMRQVSA